MVDKECTEDHDAEIVAVAKVNSDNKDAISSDMSNHCGEIIFSADLAKLNEFSETTSSTRQSSRTRRTSPTATTSFATSRATSGKLDEKILD